MQRSNISFGSDGWRGITGVDITPKTVAEAAQAFADYLIATLVCKDCIRVAVEYDSRDFSQRWAQLFSRVLSGNSIDVYLSDKIIPTPSSLH